MGQFKDLSGQKFGELTVIKDDGMRQNKKVLWLCRCVCGNLVRVSGSNLISGNTTSCGHAGLKPLEEYRQKVKAETPGTRLDLLGNTVSKSNSTGFRNISIMQYRGEVRYRVAVMYQRKQYGGSRRTLAEAIKLREELRNDHWPNYKGLDKSASEAKASDSLKTATSTEKRRSSKFVPNSDSEIEPDIFDISDRYRHGNHYWVGIPKTGKVKQVGIYDTLDKARLNRDRALDGKPVDKSSKYHRPSYVEPSISKTASGRYRVQIYKDSKTINVGVYDTIEQARLNKERANKGIPTDPTIKRHR